MPIGSCNQPQFLLTVRDIFGTVIYMFCSFSVFSVCVNNAVKIHTKHSFCFQIDNLYIEPFILAFKINEAVFSFPLSHGKSDINKY